MRLGEDLLRVYSLLPASLSYIATTEGRQYLSSISGHVSRGHMSRTGLSSEDAAGLMNTFGMVHVLHGSLLVSDIL